MVKRLLSLVLIIVLFVSAYSIPAYASPAIYPVVEYAVEDFIGFAAETAAGWLLEKSFDNIADWVTKDSDTSVGTHTHDWKTVGFGGSGSSKYHDYECRVCGQQLHVLDREAEDAYDDFVDSLPASGVTSSGQLTLTPLYYFIGLGFDFCSDTSGVLGLEPVYGYSDGFPTTGDRNFNSSILKHSDRENGLFVFGPDSTHNYLHFDNTSGTSPDYSVNSEKWFGVYCYIEPGSPFSKYYVSCDDVVPINLSCTTGTSTKDSTPLSCSFSYSSEQLDGSYFTIWCKPSLNPYYLSFTGNILTFALSRVPKVYMTPYEGIVNVLTDNNYNINSRTGTIVGDFGIIGDNNTMTVLQNIQVVNESSNTFYNFQTNEYQSFQSWQYDYPESVNLVHQSKYPSV